MPVPPLLDVHRHEYGNRTRITVVGDIDLDSAPLLRASLEQCLLDGIRSIDVDLSAVTFCDCTGLNLLLSARRRTAAAGGALRLRHLSKSVARLFALTGFTSLLVTPRVGLVPLPVPVRHRRSSRSLRPAMLYEATCQLADVAPVALHGVL
ncbi:STAS domain-containing protein [Streptomyces sp. RKAG337]|uniref:STAS domain-containing protein n=1 Tax=Streptomyces sp. RKAG337 TaxID=2893404 RepID=UPI002033B36B|nr:STAS domain-containing protein [Streptomyces sp. RKAG337]MCM2425130.1 STAS domain-containing protein [Streptomyces sp. RKAG337]